MKRIGFIGRRRASSRGCSKTTLAATPPMSRALPGVSTKGGDLTKFKVEDQPLNACAGEQVHAHLSGGDVTSVVAGSGLTGGSTNGNATLSLASDYALPQQCAEGDIAGWDGSGWACAQAPHPDVFSLRVRCIQLAITSGRTHFSAQSSSSTRIRSKSPAWTCRRQAATCSWLASGRSIPMTM